MKLYIGDRLLNMEEDELDKLYLNEGSEGVIYRLGSEVLKVYKDNPLIDKLSKESIDDLKTLNLKRILVPNESLLDENGNTIGYSSKYLEEDSFEKIFSMDASLIKNEIYLLIDDIRTLSRHGYEIDDLHLCNLIVSNNKIYFIDPGAFHKTKDEFDELYRINRYKFDNFIVNDLFASSLSKKNRKKLEKAYDTRCDLMSFLDEMDDDENIKNFAKKVIR